MLVIAGDVIAKCLPLSLDDVPASLFVSHYPSEVNHLAVSSLSSAYLFRATSQEYYMTARIANPTLLIDPYMSILSA